jgi:hypothetical protein
MEFSHVSASIKFALQYSWGDLLLDNRLKIVTWDRAREGLRFYRTLRLRLANSTFGPRLWMPERFLFRSALSRHSDLAFACLFYIHSRYSLA